MLVEEGLVEVDEEEDEDDDLEDESFDLVLLMVSLIPSDPGFTMYSGFLAKSPGFPKLLALFTSVPLVGVGIRSRLPLPPLEPGSEPPVPDELMPLPLLILALIPPLLMVTAMSSPVVC